MAIEIACTSSRPACKVVSTVFVFTLNKSSNGKRYTIHLPDLPTRTRQ